jgi:hypothetical protein
VALPSVGRDSGCRRQGETWPKPTRHAQRGSLQQGTASHVDSGFSKTIWQGHTCSFTVSIPIWQLGAERGRGGGELSLDVHSTTARQKRTPICVLAEVPSSAGQSAKVEQGGDCKRRKKLHTHKRSDEPVAGCWDPASHATMPLCHNAPCAKRAPLLEPGPDVREPTRFPHVSTRTQGGLSWPSKNTLRASSGCTPAPARSVMLAWH